MQQVAQEAKVARTTVSGILNQRADCRVSEQTRQRVLKVAKRLGYQPSQLARALKGLPTRTMGMIMPGGVAREEVVLERYRAFLEAARAHQYHPYFSFGGQNASDEPWLLEHMLQRRVDGIVIGPDARPGVDHELLRQIVDDGFPIVTINAAGLELSADDVGIDYAHGGMLQAKHLLELGRRKLALIRFDRHSFSIESRMDSLVRHWRAAGRCAPTQVRLPYDARANDSRMIEQIVASTRQLLEQHPGEIDSIVGSNDLFALACMRAVLSLGLRIPDDVAVMGFDGLRFGQACPVPLTTIMQPAAAMGQQAFHLLQQRLEKQSDTQPARRVLLKPQLVARASTMGATAAEYTASGMRIECHLSR